MGGKYFAMGLRSKKSWVTDFPPNKKLPLSCRVEKFEKIHSLRYWRLAAQICIKLQKIDAKDFVVLAYRGMIGKSVFIEKMP